MDQKLIQALLLLVFDVVKEKYVVSMAAARKVVL